MVQKLTETDGFCDPIPTTLYQTHELFLGECLNGPIISRTVDRLVKRMISEKTYLEEQVEISATQNKITGLSQPFIISKNIKLESVLVDMISQFEWAYLTRESHGNI
ncbi:hypothetical protein RF11_15388 [Thelohanellus kitauei]|uniref:Uncharacterized protein n=1 Tax=Thelohanellus kitauei TaxID=669202 RepID=A0A0C2LZU8_THEKT|nr:hypothetical protein RF11_15388 [Thelohanellus kitauei]